MTFSENPNYLEKKDDIKKKNIFGRNNGFSFILTLLQTSSHNLSTLSRMYFCIYKNTSPNRRLFSTILHEKLKWKINESKQPRNGSKQTMARILYNGALVTASMGARRRQVWHVRGQLEKQDLMGGLATKMVFSQNSTMGGPDSD